MPDRDPNELADALRKMAQDHPPHAADDAAHHGDDAAVQPFETHTGDGHDADAIEEMMAEHLAPLTPPPRVERPSDPIVARRVRPPAPGVRAIEPVAPAAPKPSFRPASPLDRPQEAPAPPSAEPPAPTEKSGDGELPGSQPASPPAPPPAAALSARAQRPDAPAEPVAPAEVAQTGLDDIVETDDDLIDMPAPSAEMLGTPAWVGRVRPADERRRPMFLQRTLIPILLTLGVLAPGLAFWLMRLPEESDLREIGQRLSIGLIAAGGVFLVLAAVNMYVVHTNLKRQTQLADAADAAEQQPAAR